MKKVERKTIKIDAKGKILGRLACEIVGLLTGKRKVSYLPNIDVGDAVLVYNVAYLKVTGRKLLQKRYFKHSGFPGGLKVTTLKEMFEKNPKFILKHAVEGMLPKNKLQKHWLKRLKLYPGEING